MRCRTVVLLLVAAVLLTGSAGASRLPIESPGHMATTIGGETVSVGIVDQAAPASFNLIMPDATRAAPIEESAHGAAQDAARVVQASAFAESRVPLLPGDEVILQFADVQAVQTLRATTIVSRVPTPGLAVDGPGAYAEASTVVGHVSTGLPAPVPVSAGLSESNPVLMGFMKPIDKASRTTYHARVVEDVSADGILPAWESETKAATETAADALYRPITIQPLVLDRHDTYSPATAAPPIPAAERFDVSPAHAAVAAVALGLLGLLPWALYHRVRGHETLENGTRKRIYDTVCEKPGVGVQEIAKAAGVTYSTATYHLERLVGARILVVSDAGSKLRYYKNGGAFNEDDRALLPLLKNREALRVLEFIQQNPATYRAAIAEALGVTATTVNWHLKRLLATGLVLEERRGRSAHLFVNAARVSTRFAALAEKLDESDAMPESARRLATPAAA